MTAPPYPLQPEPVKKTWLERNPLWKIPLGFLTLLLLIGIFGTVLLTIIVSSFRSSDVYKDSVARATASQQVRDRLGEPIKPGWFISGQMNVSNNTGNANLSIPISGPRGKGIIRAVAAKNGTWTFSFLQVIVEGRSENIDLLSIQPPSEREF
jgi:hypothetical protein